MLRTEEKVPDHGVSGVTLIIANAIICSLLSSEATILCGCVQKLADIEVFRRPLKQVTVVHEDFLTKGCHSQ